jgi:hypothetical protein
MRISASPILTMACHCKGCQRMSASAFSLGAAIPSEGFEVIQGEPVIGGLHGANRHYFCAYCMSWIFTRALFKTNSKQPARQGWLEPCVEGISSRITS